MLTSYFGLGQFMIIWSADIPEETAWYFHRMRGGWEDVGLLLVVGMTLTMLCNLLVLPALIEWWLGKRASAR